MGPAICFIRELGYIDDNYKTIGSQASVQSRQKGDIPSRFSNSGNPRTVKLNLDVGPCI